MEGRKGGEAEEVKEGGRGRDRRLQGRRESSSAEKVALTNQ